MKTNKHRHRRCCRWNSGLHRKIYCPIVNPKRKLEIMVEQRPEEYDIHWHTTVVRRNTHVRFLFSRAQVGFEVRGTLWLYPAANFTRKFAYVSSTWWWYTFQTSIHWCESCSRGREAIKATQGRNSFKKDKRAALFFPISSTKKSCMCTCILHA